MSWDSDTITRGGAAGGATSGAAGGASAGGDGDSVLLFTIEEPAAEYPAGGSFIGRGVNGVSASFTPSHALGHSRLTLCCLLPAAIS